MDTRPASPRIRRIAVTLLLTLLSVSLAGLMLWLLIAPPAALAPYQPRFQFALNLFFGLWFLSGGLFFHSRFAKAIGTGQNTPLVLWIGPKGARLFFLLLGLFFLTLGVVEPLVSFLLQWFVK
jgi:hypothetical protein